MRASQQNSLTPVQAAAVVATMKVVQISDLHIFTDHSDPRAQHYQKIAVERQFLNGEADRHLPAGSAVFCVHAPEPCRFWQQVFPWEIEVALVSATHQHRKWLGEDVLGSLSSVLDHIAVHQHDFDLLVISGDVSRRRDCHSAAPHSPSSRCFNMDGAGMPAK